MTLPSQQPFLPIQRDHFPFKIWYAPSNLYRAGSGRPGALSPFEQKFDKLLM